ncbi:MAG: L,D-transpeptidase/peptidoglycan binding protein [Roseburia sp.]|nr:L,D-transpeptidase/peptidoglycan binding protein [Roseburia sp.]
MKRKPRPKLKFYSKLLLLCCAAIYVAMVIYFWNRFAPNVWINGIYCTGKTAEEVNRELLASAVLPEKLVVTGYLSEEGTEGSQTLVLADIAFSMDYLEELKEHMNNQIPWRWPACLTASQNHEVPAAYSYDTAKLISCLESMSVYTQEDMPEDYFIQYAGSGQGYTLYDGMMNRLDTEAAVKCIKEALTKGQEEVNLMESGCYYDVPLSRKQENTRLLWTKLESFQQNSPSYDFEEEKLQLSPDDMVSFIQKSDDRLPLVDEEGAFVLDEEAIALFVEKMANEYDTYKKDWSFLSTRGDTVAVQGETYGGIIDRETEILWLTEYLNRLLQGEPIAAEEKIHIPVYRQEPYYRGKDSVGPTYIEVDMTEQRLYYYDEGRLTLETDVVTGSVRPKRETPEGVNYVYAKQQNRTLRGPGYATFVKYWMPVNGNIGLHDASWRKEFGGDIYLTNGSHGCVNLPSDKADELYQEVEIGTPVVMFY